MKRLAIGGALGIIIAGGLAVLALFLASIWGGAARANPGLTVGIDGNPSATPANTATSLGSREACISKPAVVAESGAQCTDAESGTQCSNSTDDDGDTKVNDGCPKVGATSESGAQCNNATDDDSDGKVNDGCPAVATDDDGDTSVNDGCPAVGAAETGTNCDDAVDNDADGTVNDGCPATGVPFNVDITVAEVSQVKAWEATIAFNPAILKVTGSDVNYFMAANGGSVFDFSSPVPDRSGYYLTGALDSANPGTHTGSGVLDRLTLQAVANGASQLSFFDASLEDTNMVELGDYNHDGWFDGPMFKAGIAVGVQQPDADGDGVCDGGDNCPNASNAGQQDADSDGAGDVCDNCPTTFNPTQSDVNHNGVGDACEDSDHDGVIDAVDNCPLNANPNQLDSDHDGKGDVCDPDDDNDGICDPGVVDPSCTGSDNCPLIANASQTNTDGDALGDACDPDDDNDGFTDARESAAGSNPLNSNSTPELCDGIDNDGDTQVDEGYDNNANTIPDCTEPGLDTDGDMRAESGAECVDAESGTQCSNSADDDGDTKVNDGCPQVGATAESGTQCSNSTDDDGDGKVNDGCPAVATDNDADTFVNDGCPAVGASETGTQCANSVDDDGDGAINDGCPIAGYANPADTDDDNDTFSDTRENWMGTDSLDACPDNVNDPAWPPDLDNSGRVNVLDFLVFKPALGSHFGGQNPKDPYYDRRFDLNADTYVNVLDMLSLKPYLNKSCS